MNFSFPLLTADQIEVKVKQVTAKGAVLLLYKTARTDMDLLDSVIGPCNWANDYTEHKGNLYCGIGIYDTDSDRWIWKWDCGIESRADSEGNQKKGEASDAFKRAGFRWGIGRELYSSPFIFVKVPTKPKGSNFELEDRFQSFEVKEIQYAGREICGLLIVDNKGQEWYRFGTAAKRPQGSVKSEPEPAPISGPRMADSEQIDFLADHASAEQMEAMINKYGLNLERLTYANAEKLIAKLKGAA